MMKRRCEVAFAGSGAASDKPLSIAGSGCHFIGRTKFHNGNNKCQRWMKVEEQLMGRRAPKAPSVNKMLEAGKVQRNSLPEASPAHGKTIVVVFHSGNLSPRKKKTRPIATMINRETRGQSEGHIHPQFCHPALSFIAQSVSRNPTSPERRRPHARQPERTEAPSRHAQWTPRDTNTGHPRTDGGR